jgi:MMPL family
VDGPDPRLATFLLLFLAFGSLILPLQAIVMNILSLSAMYGVVTWIFADEHLSGLLGFTPNGTISPTIPILMFAIMFGLSMDYEVFLLSRIRESYDITGDNTTAIASGLQRTGGVITSAALLLIIVIGLFSLSSITFIKMLGVGMIVALILDATLVRMLLVPATLRLLGPPAGGHPLRYAASTPGTACTRTTARLRRRPRTRTRTGPHLAPGGPAATGTQPISRRLTCTEGTVEMNLNDTTTTARIGNTSYLDRPGGRIGYDVAGAGPLVVLVPGMGDLRAAYRFLAPALRAAGYRVACTDLRGHATATPRSRPTAMSRPRTMSPP